MLARSDHDFVLNESRPRRRASRSKPDARAAVLLRTLFRNPGRTVLGASSAALAVGIMINAMVLQTGQHPAPFFRSFAEPARPAPNAVVMRLPPARPVDLTNARRGRVRINRTRLGSVRSTLILPSRNWRH